MLQASQILPGLYQRGRLNRSWSQDRLITELKETGIDSVVSVYPGGEPLLENQNEIIYEHYPFNDNKRDGIPERIRWVGVGIGVSVEKGERILVTCKRGRNRSGLVVALAVMHILDCDADEAIAHIRSLRQMKPPVLSNESFQDFLQSHSGRIR